MKIHRREGRPAGQTGKYAITLHQQRRFVKYLMGFRKDLKELLKNISARRPSPGGLVGNGESGAILLKDRGGRGGFLFNDTSFSPRPAFGLTYREKVQYNKSGLLAQRRVFPRREPAKDPEKT